MAKILINGTDFSTPLVSTDAKRIEYDNSTSGLSASNVQSAIDEVNGKIDNTIFVDYSNKVPIANTNSASGSFTAPRNGVALCDLQINVAGYINVTINGIFVATSSIVGGIIIPVAMKKGDVLTWSSNAENNYMRCDGTTRSIFV